MHVVNAMCYVISLFENSVIDPLIPYICFPWDRTQQMTKGNILNV